MRIRVDDRRRRPGEGGRSGSSATSDAFWRGHRAARAARTGASGRRPSTAAGREQQGADRPLPASTDCAGAPSPGRGRGWRQAAPAPIFGAMPLPRPASPARPLGRPPRLLVGAQPRHQWVAGALAVAMPIAIVVAFYLDGQTNIVPRRADHLRRELARQPHRRRDQGQAEGRPSATRAVEAERQRQFKQLDEKLEAARAFERRALDGGGDRARRARPRPDRAQSQCRLRDRQGRRRVVGRGWTQPGGRPHAEAMALAEAGDAGARRHRLRDARALRPSTASAARPAPTCWSRPAPARVVVALGDPDPRTDGAGHRAAARGRHRGRGRARRPKRRRARWPGFLTRIRLGRPFVTLKLAMSLDGKIALAVGRKPLDHRRGRARPRPSRARPRGHDPGRPRHLRGRRARGSTCACRGSRTARRAGRC